MQFYKRTKSKKTWSKHPISSFFCFLRDFIIYLTPLKHIPAPIVNALFGFVPKFIFFVHPRRAEDTYIAYPFLGLIRRWFGRNVFLRTLDILPPLVIGVVRTPLGVNGLIVTGSLLPDILLKDRKKALKHCLKGLFFSSKIAQSSAIFGLGALWPMITRRGLALRQYSEPRNIVITNGHCGTLIGIYLSIRELSKLSLIPFDRLKVAILGVGRMGTNLAHVLYGEILGLSLVDINEARLDKTIEELRKCPTATNIRKHVNHTGSLEFSDILKENHIAVCCTSNITRILKPEQIPDNTIIIDDSRPEGIPRDLGKPNCVVTEGGLMKIKGIKQNYDFGFGIDENVFGCFAESFLLASDNYKGRILKPTLGAVDFDNFKKMINVCDKFGVSLGDFKCRDKIISREKLVSIMKGK